MDVWFKFDHPDDEEPSHEANIVADGDGYRAEWSHTAVGLVLSHRFDTREAARAFLAGSGYADYTA